MTPIKSIKSFTTPIRTITEPSPDPHSSQHGTSPRKFPKTDRKRKLTKTESKVITAKCDLDRQRSRTAGDEPCEKFRTRFCRQKDNRCELMKRGLPVGLGLRPSPTCPGKLLCMFAAFNHTLKYLRTDPWGQ